MTSKSRLPGDVPDELPRELIELGKRIAAMPAGYQRDLEPIYNQVIDSRFYWLQEEWSNAFTAEPYRETCPRRP